MSGLDQVFIKAFEKETRPAAAAPLSPTPVEIDSSAATSGAWRRIERSAVEQHESPVPPPHAAFAPRGGNVTPRRVATDVRPQAAQPVFVTEVYDTLEIVGPALGTGEPARAAEAAPPLETIAVNVSKYPLISVPDSERTSPPQRTPDKKAEPVEPPPSAGDEESPGLCAWQVVVSDSPFGADSDSPSPPGAEVIDWTESLAAAEEDESDVESAQSHDDHDDDEAAHDEGPAAIQAQDWAAATTTFGDFVEEETATHHEEKPTQRQHNTAPAPAKPSERIVLVEQLQPAPPKVETISAPADHEADEFVAAWEVDRFQWPTICDQLLQSDRQYFQVAGQRLREAARDGLHVLGVTAANRGEGQTALVLCLARCAAAAGMRVAIIDADIDNPQLALRLGLGVAHGWEDFAQREIELSECAVQSVEDGFTVVPIANSRRARGHEPALAGLLRTATKRFDLLIVDMGALTSSGGRLLAACDNLPVDAAIVVRDLRSTTDVQMRGAVQQLKDAGVEAVGVAENFGPSAASAKAA